MKSLIARYFSFGDWLSLHLSPALPTLARLVFAAVLLSYFWGSAGTKLGPGLTGFLMPSDGAYIQIFPRTVEALGYDFSGFGLFHRAVVTLGTWAEFLLPLLIVLGLFTRLAALGMIGFVAVQSWVDVYGHMVGQEAVGAWFDRASDALILDQRAMWVFVLIVLVIRGGGVLSLDNLLQRRIAPFTQGS